MLELNHFFQIDDIEREENKCIFLAGWSTASQQSDVAKSSQQEIPCDQWISRVGPGLPNHTTGFP